MLLALVIGGAIVRAALLLGRAGVAVDIAGGHLAEDGEEDREAEIAAETPPHTSLKKSQVETELHCMAHKKVATWIQLSKKVRTSYWTVAARVIIFQLATRYLTPTG